MKKMILIISVALIGLVAGLIGWANYTHSRIDVSTFQFNKLQQKRLTFKKLQAITLNLRTAKVIFEKGSKSSVTIMNYIPDQMKVDGTNQTLDISQDNSDKHHLEIGASAKIIVTVGQDLDRVNVKLLNGTLQFKNITTNDLSVDHNNGTTLADGLTILKAGQITKSNGTTKLNNLSVNGLKVNVKTGAFKLDGNKQNNSYDDNHPQQLNIDSKTGQVIINRK